MDDMLFSSGVYCCLTMEGSGDKFDEGNTLYEYLTVQSTALKSSRETHWVTRVEPSNRGCGLRLD